VRNTLRVFTGIIFFFAICLLLTMTFYFFQAKGNIEKVPSVFGYRALTVLSNSMQPTFSAGDIILINNNQQPTVNDIITYKHPDGILVSHRVIQLIKKNGQTFIKTKGDNNNVDDHILIPGEDILGIEKMVVPKAGFAAKFVSGPIGIYIFVIFPILTFLVITIFEKLGLVGKKDQKETQIH
jgi:signal peptidase